MRRLAAVLTLALAATACTPTVNSGSVSNASDSVAISAAASSSQPAPTWGQRYTWPDGLAVEVSKPTACKPSQYSSVAKGVKRAVLVSITVMNGRKDPYNIVSFEVDAQFAGRKAEAVTDGDGPCKNTGITVSGTVQPGKALTFDWAFAVTAEPGELQLDCQANLVRGDKAVFVGQA